MKILLHVLLIFGILSCSKTKEDSVKYSLGEVVVKDGDGNQLQSFHLLSKSTPVKDETINEVIRYDDQMRGVQFTEKVVKKTKSTGLYVKPNFTDEIVFKYDGDVFKGFDGVNYRPDGTVANMDFDVDGPNGKFEVINKKGDQITQVVVGNTSEITREAYEKLKNQITIAGAPTNEKKETGSQ